MTDDTFDLRRDDEPAEPPTPLRTRAKGWARDLGLSILGFGALFFGLAWYRAPALPDVAPDFTLQNLEGAPIALASLRGKPVVLNFWATWCGPCALELPTLTAFEANHPDVEVLYVAVDGEAPALRAFAEAHDMPLASVLRIDKPTRDAYRVGTLPTTVIVKPDGAVGGIHAGILLPLQLSWMTGSW